MIVISVESVYGKDIKSADLSGGKVLGLERQLSCTIRPWSNLPNRGLDGIPRLNGRGEPNSVINQRIWVVVSNNGHDRSSHETKRAQSVENDTSKARRLAYPGIYRNTLSANALPPMDQPFTNV